MKAAILGILACLLLTGILISLQPSNSVSSVGNAPATHEMTDADRQLVAAQTEMAEANNRQHIELLELNDELGRAILPENEANFYHFCIQTKELTGSWHLRPREKQTMRSDRCQGSTRSKQARRTTIKSRKANGTRTL
jgi:hypothetical protein